MIRMSMETISNLLTSNSFIKTFSKRRPSTTNLLAKKKKKFMMNPLIIYHDHDIPNYSSNHMDRNHFPAITCCDLKSSSMEDNNEPSTNADWRSFRAMLVTYERISTPEESSNSLPHHPRVKKGKTWAHILHEPEKGCLLIATQKLDGVHIFERTLILILSIDSMGSTGIILNRPLPSLKETRLMVPDVENIFFERPLYYGGWLDEKLVLVGPKKGTDDEDQVIKRGRVFEEVMEGLYYGTKEESVGCVREMVKRNEIGVENFRVFEGYCWWEKDKLKEEIRDGFWKVIACSPNIIGMN